MRTLANAILDLAAFLELSGDEVVDPDAAVNALESLASALKSASPEEVAAIRSAIREQLSSSPSPERAEFLRSFEENVGSRNPALYNHALERTGHHSLGVRAGSRRRPFNADPLSRFQMPANQDKALHLLFRTIARGTGDPADDLIARLKEIEDARTDLLADDEYAAFRSMVLRQVVERVRVPLAWQLTLVVCCFGSIALIVYGVLKGGGGAIVGGGAGLLVGPYLWYGLERDYAEKRALGRDERLRTIERLVSMHLVAENEAADLRSKILAAFPAEAG